MGNNEEKIINESFEFPTTSVILKSRIIIEIN